MKKSILGLVTLIWCSTIVQAFEANIKVGYDFYRSSTFLNSYYGKPFYKYTRGFVLGVEILPITFKNEKIKLGAGVEYNFGENSVKYENEGLHSLATMIPVYATAKFTYYKPKNMDLNLYTFARLGYAFAGEKLTARSNNVNRNHEINDTNGLYYGLGLGIDYKYFLAEILYDGKYNNYTEPKQGHNVIMPTSISTYVSDKYHISHYFHHKIGVRLGLQLGTQHFKKAKIEPKKITD